VISSLVGGYEEFPEESREPREPRQRGNGKGVKPLGKK